MAFQRSIVDATILMMQAADYSHLIDMNMAAQLGENQSELLARMSELLEERAEAVRKADKDHLVQAQTEFQAAMQKSQSLESMAAANLNQATNMVANDAKARQDLQQFVVFMNTINDSVKGLISQPY